MEGGSLLVIGHKGMLGSALMRLTGPEWEVTGADLGDVDITNEGSVTSLMDRTRPDLVINCAAMTDVDGSETRYETALMVNGAGPGIIARAAGKIGAGLVHISTDFVFDGAKTTPYEEDDPPNPISAYGRSKLEGEKAVMANATAPWWIVRTSWLFGPGGKNFVDTMARLSLTRPQLRVVADQTGRPTFTEDLAHALLLLVKAPSGLYHYSNSGVATWHELASESVKIMRDMGATVVTHEIEAITTDQYPRAARPPAYSVMSTEKFSRATGLIPPPWQDALRRHLHANGLALLGKE